MILIFVTGVVFGLALGLLAFTLWLARGTWWV